MKCSVFIATSLDGYIAKVDGSVEWLHRAGDSTKDMGEEADMGFNDFISSVDSIIMGRKCMEVISGMNLTREQWPYGDLRIIVLSNSLTELPSNMKGNAELYSGDLTRLISKLEADGHNHAYIDGGTTIQGFLKLQLINEMIISKAPILLGDGIPLFGKSGVNTKFTNAEAKAFANGFVQIKYKVN